MSLAWILVLLFSRETLKLGRFTSCAAQVKLSFSVAPWTYFIRSTLLNLIAIKTNFLQTLVAFVSFANFISAARMNVQSVPRGKKLQWCTAQTDSCPLICEQTNNGDGKPKENKCDDKSLDYVCKCSNGKSPNLTDFTQTIPSFKCEQTRSGCIKDCGPTDTQCQDGCKDTKCGSKNPQEGKGSTTKSEGLPGRKYTGMLQGDSGAAALVGRYYAVEAMLVAVVGGSFALL